MNIKGLLILFLLICMLFSITACVNPFDKDEEGSGNGNIGGGELDGEDDGDESDPNGTEGGDESDPNGTEGGDGSGNEGGNGDDTETYPDPDEDKDIELPPINV